MLEFLLGKELYERFSEIKSDLKIALLISLSIYCGLFVILCFFLQGSGDPTSFKLLPSRGAKKGGMIGEKSIPCGVSKKNFSHRMIQQKENDTLDTVWGLLERNEMGKVLLTPELVTLLMQHTMIEPVPMLLTDKAKKPEKKTEPPALKKSPEKKKIPVEKKGAEKKVEKAKDKDKVVVVPEVTKAPAPEKKASESTPPLKKVEVPEPAEIISVQEKKVSQQPSKTSQAESIQENKAEAKPLKNASKEKSELMHAQIQGVAIPAAGNAQENSGMEEGYSGGPGNGYTGDIADGIGIEFTDGSYRNDRPDSYYLQLVEEINNLIKEQWQPLAGWEDAGAVVVEIKMDKNGACASRIITASKAGAMNHRALTIARLIGSFGKIRGRTFNLMFM